MTTMYLEYNTDLSLAAALEGWGRAYAASECTRLGWPVHYPLSPENHNGGSYPTYANGQPPPAGYTWVYAPGIKKVPEGSGGVIELYDDLAARYAPQTLSDESSWSCDIEAEAKTVEQLSAAGQAAIAPPPPPPPPPPDPD